MKLRSHIFKRAAALFLVVGSFSFATSCSFITLRDNTETNNTHDKSEKIFSVHDAEPDSDASSLNRINEENAISDTEYSLRDEAVEWITLYEEKFGDNSARQIIMTENEITEYNKKLISECPSIYDMTSPPATIDGKEVREAIERYSMPHGDKYDKHKNVIGNEEREKIKDNRNIESIPDIVKPQYGIVTQRCNLRGFPTDIGFYDGESGYYSSIQETELITSFPAIVLHKSADNQFYFVRSYFYSGWVKASCIGTTDFDTYLDCISLERFITVLEPEIEFANTILSMGCKLKYISEDDNYYYVSMPISDTSGKLTFTTASIDKKYACYGYLEYNVYNYYRQAFSYLGTMYSWGGENSGVDCSGFVCAVFRTFGIYLPRNTGEQSNHNGIVVSANTTDLNNALKELRYPASVHRKGHVMLYLGEKDSVHYIIHAPQGGERVSVAPLYLPGNITNVCIINIDK